MKILLVEDELHKREELTECIEEFFSGEAQIVHVDSVHGAYWEVSTTAYDLILLDMALPTLSSGEDVASRSHDQALGGVEVLRALKPQNGETKVIIITQYPDILVGGKRIKLNEASKVLSARYGQRVIGSVLYKYKSPSNKIKLTELLRKVL